MDWAYILPHLDSSSLRIDPIERSETIPASWYTNPSFFELDRKLLRGFTWHFVGHQSQISSPGEFLRADILGESILVVRGETGEIRAFYNVCRHRGGPLALHERGRVNMLQCKYHGWTYKLDGSLRGVPRFDRVDLFDRKDYGLIQVDLASWEGLLFVRFNPGYLPLSSLLKGISQRIAPAKLESLQFYRRVTYELACNWKVYVDNYLEGYHLPYVHPELCDILEYRDYVTEIAEHYSVQISPLSAADNPYSASEGYAFYFFVFPNLTLNILPGRLQTNVILPVDHDKTLVLFDYFYADVDSDRARERIEQDIAFSDQVQQEDIVICEHVHRGLHSSAYDKGRFSVECEEGVYHFQALLKQFYKKMVDQYENEQGTYE